MLKNTGVIRKIDELGRIVIPKEIRSVLNIKSGDNLMFSIDDHKIILEKYSQMNNMKEKSLNLLANTYDLVDGSIFISDEEKFISKGILENKKLNEQLLNILKDRKNYESDKEDIMLIEKERLEGYFIIKPLLKESNPIGLLFLYKKGKITKEDEIFMSILKNIIENN